MSTRLREALPGDVPLLLALIRELADYERAPECALATEADLAEALFGKAPLAHAMIAEHDGAVAGYAVWFYAFSTWTGRPSLYLEDLFVRPAHRGKGIGKALLKKLAAVALERGCPRYQWAVLDWNQPSIDFYEGLGAKAIREWVNMRVEGAALENLARDGA